MNLRSFRSSALISIFCGILVFFLFRFFVSSDSGELRARRLANPPSAMQFDGCAILVFDEFMDDRFIRESLERGGIEGIISESTQLIPVDDFGKLKMIPLDSYSNEIETFDPRNDGYAEKLSSFFVHDGKRFFFIPIENISAGKAASLRKQLKSLLGEIPFSLGILGHSRPVFWYFVLLAAACGAALYFSQSRQLFIFGLPVLLAFGWSGSAAFVLAAIVSGIWELLREPLRELWRLRSEGFGYFASSFAGVVERLRPFGINLLLVLLFLVFFVVYSVVKAISPIPLAAGFGSFFFLCFFVFKTEAIKARKNKHFIFAPVPLLPLRVRTFCLFPFLLPFCAGAVLALILPLLFPSLSPFGDEISELSSGRRYNDPLLPDTSYFVSAEDYHRYIDFQSSFSYKSLDQIQGEVLSGIKVPDNFEGGDYLRYYLGEDGLIAGGVNYGQTAGSQVEHPSEKTVEKVPEAPQFPLEKLMGFLLHYNRLTMGEPGRIKPVDKEPIRDSAVMVKEWISVVIIIAVCLLDFFRFGVRDRKMKKIPFFWDRRIAA